MKNSSLVMFLGVIFIVLILGLMFTSASSGGGIIPAVEQVSSADASPLHLTKDKTLLLVVVGAIAIGSTLGMGATLAGAVWFLNREVVKVQQQPEQPFELLSFSTEGNTTGALLANNAFYLVIGIGLAMLAAAVAALVLL